MKNLYSLFLMPIIVFATHGSVRIEDSAKGRDTIIRVLTHTDLDGALIEVKSGFTIQNPSTLKKVDTFYTKQRHYLSTCNEGLKWGKLYKGVHQIEFTPKDKNTTFLIGGIQYSGKLTAYDIASKLFLVVEVDVDHYLKSILSGRFAEKNLHQTTLESLAIALRTDLYHKIATSTNPFWDIKAETHGFAGSSLQVIGSNANNAVNATKDLIMLYENRPFPTTWSDDCGGKTASYKVIFRKDVPSPAGVFVPFAQKIRNENRWKCSLSKREFAKMLELDSIQSIEPFKDSTTDKIYAMRINGRGLTFRELTILDLQSLIGKDRLKSNDFSIKLIDERIEFSGFGSGLGVGICLLSAKEMAESGKSTAKVLAAFYPETKIIKLDFVPQVFFEEDPIEE